QIVTGYNPHSEIKARNALKAAKCLFVVTIEPHDHAPCKVNNGIVAGFPRQLFCRLSRAPLFAAREVNEDHVPACFQQTRIEREGFIECLRGSRIIARFPATLYHSISISFAQRAVREGK